MNLLQNRDLRQRDILPPALLAKLDPTVIGVGAIGRQVALQLAAIGLPRLRLIDPDVVDVVNLAPQGYAPDELGLLKVQATANACRRLLPTLEIETVAARFHRRQPVGDVVFCCVDSIETRRHIWKAVSPSAILFVDGRMAAEVLRILTASNPDSRVHYESTLFTAGEAHAGACTAKSTIYCANVAAGLMVAQLARWLRRIPLDPDLQLNLLTGEWTAHELRQPVRQGADVPNKANRIELELVDADA